MKINKNLQNDLKTLNNSLQAAIDYQNRKNVQSSKVQNTVGGLGGASGNNNEIGKVMVSKQVSNNESLDDTTASSLTENLNVSHNSSSTKSTASGKNEKYKTIFGGLGFLAWFFV